MRCSGRVRSVSFVSFFSRAIYICASIAVTESADYGVPIEIKAWDTGRTPLAHMVDVTNEFGLKVLAEHNFLNDNNIAFSPYGLMGILVALYEGVDGASSYELQRGIQLPWNRNVMRIGFRDIHRTLKTYFVPEEGFLAGLALNNENITFHESYKKILRFYGFDLDNDQLPTFTSPDNNTTNVTTTTAPPNDASSVPTSTTSTLTTVSMTTENKPREETTPTASSESTTNPNAETINPISSTTESSSSAPNAETTITTSVITTTIPPTSRESTPIETTTSTPVTTTGAVSTEKESILSTTASTTLPNIQTTVVTTTREITSETSTPTISMATSNDDPTTTDIASSTITSSTTDVTTSLLSTTITSTDATNMITNSVTEETSTLVIDLTTTADSSTTTANNSTLETLERRKKSIVDFIFTNPPYIYDYVSYRSFDIPADLPSNFDDKMFLANGLKSVQVTYMHYDTVLEHAYLPHLEASALRLPLDSERYYLLVVLPARRGPAELGRLLSRMARESDLSDIYAALRPRRIRGSVPSFIVKGHVTLTTDLQKLGIRNVFEPRQRDFTLMTSQAGVYVRSIEQAVSVAIRKYQPDDHKRNRYVTNREPITFYATYPFLYFVMDASIHVSLMAGKMVDPLNTRIL